ncbi:MAG: BrnT family toxin [bacterium]
MEQRFYALGRTNQDRLLFVVYTIRSNKIRVISARDMNKRERGCYQ